MVYWEECIEKFYNFEECRKRWCRYHGNHYADEVIVVNVLDAKTYKIYKSAMYLYHTNKIAELNEYTKILEVKPHGYLTPTTRDRINRILAYKFGRRFSVNIATNGMMKPLRENLFMYIIDYDSKKAYMLSDGWTDFTFKIKLNGEIIEKGRDVVVLEKSVRSKKTIAKDIFGNEYVKIGEYLISIKDLKFFKMYEKSKTYAVEVNSISIEDEDCIRFLSKRFPDIYISLVAEVM